MLTGDDPGSVPPHRRISVGYADALLAGGLATTMLTTVYGKEGAGKSTLALELACAAARSVPTLYAVAPGKQHPDDILRLARRVGAEVAGMCLSTIDTIDDAIDAAQEFGARLLVLDSLNATADFHASRMKAGVRRLQEWCLAADAAALGIAMYDTAGRRAGGYSVAYLGGAIKRVGSDYCELPGPPHDNGLRLGCGSTHGCVRRTRKLADTISRSWSGLLATDAIAAPLVS